MTPDQKDPTINHVDSAHQGHDEEAKKDARFEEIRKNTIIEGLLAGKNLQEIMESIDNLSEMFKRALDTVVCADGRVPATIDGVKLGIAGQGILLPPEEYKKLVEVLKVSGVKTVTSHDGCGAAGIVYDKMKEAGTLPKGINSSDELGRWFSKKLAGDIGAEHYHISMEEMNGMEGEHGKLHEEQGVWIDTTKRANPAALSKKDVPPVYVASGAGFEISEEECQKEIEALAGISLGDHGFGKRFTTENPFYFIISAKDEADLAKWTAMAERAASKLNGRVAVKGFIVSEEIQKEYFDKK